jgi:hypothetical protein
MILLIVQYSWIKSLAVKLFFGGRDGLGVLCIPLETINAFVSQ